MEKILHWSIANAQGDKDAIKRAGELDPKLLQKLFGGGGPDDPTLMKEAMLVVTNVEADLENKLIAIDNFEMLIENLDNANNLENMKLWDPILDILEYEEKELRTAALSIIGTAVQNNTSSQESFIKYDRGLPSLIRLSSDTNEPVEVRIKAFYALSNLVRNQKEIGQRFFEANGLDIIAPALSDSKSTTKQKMRAVALLAAFLTSTSIDSSLIEVLRKDRIIESTIDCLDNETDLNVIDSVLNFLSQLISASITFNEKEMEKLRTGFQHIEQFKDRLNEDDYLAVKYVL